MSGVGSAVRMALAIGVAAVGVAACGGSGGGGNSAPSTAGSSAVTFPSSFSTVPSNTGSGTGLGSTGSASSSVGAIRNTWTAFFAGSTPEQQKVGLLQNGQQFASYIQQQKENPLAQQTSAQVSDLTVNGNTATVKYTILINNQPALPNQTGQAVLENGQWKVSDASFCSLLSLQGGAPPACSSASGSASASSSASG